MNEAEFLTSLIQIGVAGGPNGVLIAIGYFIWKLQKNYEKINHNSTKIVKALIKKGILDADDIEDVQL